MLKEVEYIDGVQEFLEEGYVTELLEKNTNTFFLTGDAAEGSVNFSGDTSLFKKQVYKKEDLVLEGAWAILDQVLYINPKYKTSPFTFTYITYKRRSKYKREGLFSVDYEKGFLYTSTPTKNLDISYRYTQQYLVGQQMNQIDHKEYGLETVYSIPVDNTDKLSYIYQNTETVNAVTGIEYYEGGRVNIVTLGDKDE